MILKEETLSVLFETGSPNSGTRFASSSPVFVVLGLSGIGRISKWLLVMFRVVPGRSHRKSIRSSIMHKEHPSAQSHSWSRLSVWLTEKQMTLTLVYFMHSSQFVLTRGIIPSLCAINSSGKTVVFDSNSTKSMAKKRRVLVMLLAYLNDIHRPTVGISAIIVLRKEFANLQTPRMSKVAPRFCKYMP